MSWVECLRVIGGEVPRLVAVEGSVLEDGRSVLTAHEILNSIAHHLQLPDIPSSGGRVTAPVAILSDGRANTKARRRRPARARQSCSHTALSIRCGLHLRALGQDHRRRPRLEDCQRESRGAASHDSPHEEGCACESEGRP